MWKEILFTQAWVRDHITHDQLSIFDYITCVLGWWKLINIGKPAQRPAFDKKAVDFFTFFRFLMLIAEW